MFTVPYAVRADFEASPASFPSYKISHFPWSAPDGYCPEAYASVVHDDEAFYVRLMCAEKDPYCVVHEWNGDVWCDSALEFFIEPVRGKGYFNFEMNSYPTMLAYFGILPDDDKRVPVDYPHDAFHLRSRQWEEDGKSWWEVRLTVPFAVLKYYVPEFTPAAGLTIHANAYKCGDNTPQPHFGCLNPIDPEKVPEPAFHVPEFFGEWVLEANLSLKK